MKKRELLFFLLLLLTSVNAFAAKRYWVASSARNWSPGRWASTSGGTSGASTPGSSDTAYFDGNGVGDCTINLTLVVAGINMSPGYTGTISQGANTVTIGAGNASLSGGTFNGGSANITISGALTISGTSFTSTSDTLIVSGDFTLSSGSFTHNSGTTLFDKPNIITGTIDFYKLTFNPGSGGSYLIYNTITANNDLILDGSDSIRLDTGTITAKANLIVSNTNTNGGGTATIEVSGSGTLQSITGSATTNAGVLPNLTFTASSPTTDSVISGTNLNVKGTMSLAGSGAITLKTGTINLQGDLSSSNISTSTGGDALLVINGSSTQVLQGSGSTGTGKFPNISINKSNTLTLTGTINVAGDWTYTAGIVIPGTSSVALYGTFNLDAQGTSTTMSFYNLATGSGTRTLTGNLDVDNNLSIANGSTLSAGSYSIAVGGQWNSQGTWTAGTSTVTFDGTGYKQITGLAATTISFYNLVFNKTANSLTLSRPVKVNNSLTLTSGHIKTTTSNYLELADNVTCTGGGTGAYVHGPVRKTGNDAFTFPLGDTTLSDAVAYHPLTMTAPSSVTDQFQAIYKPSGQTYGTTLASTLASVSTCEYWTFERKNGSSTPTITLGWKSNCDNGGYEEMSPSLWNGSQWTDLGQGTLTVSSSTAGTIAASSATSFTVNPAPITIGYKQANKSYAVISKNPGGGYCSTDNNILYFSFDEEYGNSDDLLTYSITRISTDRADTLISNSPNLAVVSYGHNRYKIDLYDSSNSPLASGYYMLEVVNDKNEKWYLRFKI